MSFIKNLTAKQIYEKLIDISWSNYKGSIRFDLANISVKIETKDIVGSALQSWIKEYLNKNHIYFREPNNTQEFPDFYLDDKNLGGSMLEIKAFNYKRNPAFDIANFDSYCLSVQQKPYFLDADYIIFGYDMDLDSNIIIKKIWIKKIWEISGESKKYPLKTQVKKGIIYNIRPNSTFKSGKDNPFKNKENFLEAIYKTLIIYKGEEFADVWKTELLKNYESYYGVSLSF